MSDLKVEKVLCERWIIVDEYGIRRSGWYQTPEGAEQAIPTIQEKLAKEES